MTRVRLPPDPETNCVTTIVDSQGGDAALMSALAAKAHVAMRRNDSLAALLERVGAATIEAGGGIEVAGTIGTPPRASTSTGIAASPALSTASTAPGGGSVAASPVGGSMMTGSSSSSGAGSASGVDNVDSILLVYDLDRVETFYRLENHWLPLIEKCYDGKVGFLNA